MIYYPKIWNGLYNSICLVKNACYGRENRRRYKKKMKSHLQYKKEQKLIWKHKKRLQKLEKKLVEWKRKSSGCNLGMN